MLPFVTVSPTLQVFSDLYILASLHISAGAPQPPVSNVALAWLMTRRSLILQWERVRSVALNRATAEQRV